MNLFILNVKRSPHVTLVYNNLLRPRFYKAFNPGLKCLLNMRKLLSILFGTVQVTFVNESHDIFKMRLELTVQKEFIKSCGFLLCVDELDRQVVRA